MGSSMGCCTDDPTGKLQTNMDRETEGQTLTENEERGDSKPTTKQAIPDDSYLKPITNDDNAEESLLVPSTLSAVDNDHDPVPPSDYEDNTDEYALKQDENTDADNTDADNNPDDDDKDDNTIQNDDNNSNNDDDNNNNNDDNNNNNDDVEDDIEPGMEPSDDKESKEDGGESEAVVIPKHRQVLILENVELRERSVSLVTGDNGEFIKFLRKILKSKLNEKIWAKCDPNNTEKIETDKFMYFWTLPVTLFKVAIYQRQNGNKEKPKVDQKELKKDFTHLATWIIRKYGDKEDDGGCSFVLTKSNFTKDIVEYVKNYADVKGELYEDY